MSEKVAKESTSPQKDSDRFLISDLCELVGTYMDQEQVKQVYDAYLFGAQAHEGQIRISGEPYIYHPIAVARILAEMHMDVKSIVASILHDVIEDTPATQKLIANEFGDDVAKLVDGVSKLTHLKFKNKIEEQAENIQKVLLAMSEIDSVIVDDSRVDYELQGRMQRIIQQFGSERAIQEAYGKSVEQFMDELRPGIEEQVLVIAARQRQDVSDIVSN